MAKGSDIARNRFKHAEDVEIAQTIMQGKENSSDAESALYDRFAGRIRLFAIRHLGRGDDVFDLVHDVMIIAIEKLRQGQVKEPEKIGSFILGIARKFVYQQYRRRSRESLPGENGFKNLQNKPERQYDIAYDMLKKCLESLIERERSVLLLTYFAEQSTKAISESFGIAPGNVRVIRHRGMENLRGCVGIDWETVK